MPPRFAALSHHFILRALENCSRCRKIRCVCFRRISCRERQPTTYSVAICVGAGRGSRTPKTRRSADFESAASASSAIPALLVSAWFYDLFLALFLFIGNGECATV